MRLLTSGETTSANVSTSSNGRKCHVELPGSPATCPENMGPQMVGNSFDDRHYDRIAELFVGLGVRNRNLGRRSPRPVEPHKSRTLTRSESAWIPAFLRDEDF